jgi:hypothetical protein
MEVMQIWKEHFLKFQLPDNRFYPTMVGIQPGETLLIEAKVPALPGTPSILPVSTGVIVLYADDEMFTVMNPQGHPLSGWNTFSAYEEDGYVVAQVQEQSRASDPMYEFFFRFFGSSGQQDKIWIHVLNSLADYLGAKGQVTVSKTLIDPQVQWSQAKNIWHNAAIRTVIYVLATPLRWLGKPFKNKRTWTAMWPLRGGKGILWRRSLVLHARSEGCKQSLCLTTPNMMPPSSAPGPTGWPRPLPWRAPAYRCSSWRRAKPSVAGRAHGS